MKLISWNVRGLGAPPIRALVKSLLSKINPDLVILQETKLEYVNRFLVKSIWSSRNFGWPGYAFMEKLKGLKPLLVKWNKESFGRVDDRMRQFQAKLDEIDKLEENEGMTADLNGKRTSLKAEYMDLAVKEQHMWAQKCK